MSQLTFWLAVSAAAFVILFLANAVAYRIRFGTFLRASARASAKTRRLSSAQIVVGVLPAAAMLVGIAAPVMAPESSLAQWLNQPYALVAYFVWCLLLGGIAGAAQALYVWFSEVRSHEQA